MQLYSAMPVRYNASNWYRTIMPWRTAFRLKLANAVIDHNDLIAPDLEAAREQHTMYADIIQQYQSYSPHMPGSVEMAKAFPPYWRPDGTWNVGPSFIFDTDDDLFRVEPLNPAFKHLGWQVDGKPINKKGAVWITDAEGKKRCLWQDGSPDAETGLDVAENLRKLAQVRVNMKAAALITCSTEGARAYVKRETGRDDVHIFPNCIDFADFPRVEHAPSSRVRILWQASSTHFEDMWPLVPVLKRIHADYPNVDFTLFGSPYKWLTDALDPARTEIIPWCHYQEYKLRLSCIGHDINLAPLHDSEFNRSRSGIRMYESAACWKPAATLAERTGVYAEEIQDGVTGMLFSGLEEFEQKLRQLIEDTQLRKAMAASAKDWVRDNRDPVPHTTALIEAFQRIRDERRAGATPPPPPEEENHLVTIPTHDHDAGPGEDAGSTAGQ